MSVREWAFLAATLFFTLSIILWIASLLRYRGYSTAQATVASVEVEFDSDGNKQFYAVYTFRDSMGREFTNRSIARSNFSPYQDGQTLQVLYHPENPDRVTINSFREKYAWALTLFAFGIFAVIVALIAR